MTIGYGYDPLDRADAPDRADRADPTPTRPPVPLDRGVLLSEHGRVDALPTPARSPGGEE